MTHRLQETVNGILPQDKIPYQIYTDPAIRAVGGLTHSEHAEFQNLEDGKAQEAFLKRRWTKLDDKLALARHSGARALQAITELVYQEDFSGTAEVRRIFQLGTSLYPESAESDTYLRITETEFIKGFNGLWELVTSQEALLDIAEPGKTSAEYRDQRACFFAPTLGCLSVSRVFDRYEEADESGRPFGVSLPYNTEFAFMRTTEADQV